MSTHSVHFIGDCSGGAGGGAPVRVVFMGTPDFAVPTLEALAASEELQVAAVCVPPGRPQGRGLRVGAAPVKRRAEELGIPVMEPRSLRSPEAIAELRAWSPGLSVVAAYGRILPPEALALPRFGALNLHPSLLPRHRGPSPVAGTILAGDETTGITLMLLDEGMDTGPIIAQREREVVPSDDAASLTAALFAEGAVLLSEALPQWLRGELTATPQDDATATYTTKLERADGAVDWSRPADAIVRQGRAYTPWPGLYTRWGDRELKLLAVERIPGRGAAPGTVDSREDYDIVVGTGDGMLAVTRLQLEGRRAVDAGDFVRGYPDVIGDRLG